MAVTIVEVFAPEHAYRVNNGVYTVDIGIDRFKIISLERLDASGVVLIDDFPDLLGKGHPKLFYQTEVNNQVHEQWVLPTHNAWTVSYMAVGADIWVQGETRYRDVDTNHLKLTFSFIISDAVGYLGCRVDLTCNNKIAWASFRDLQHIEAASSLLFFSHLIGLDDFSLYPDDPTIQAAWNSDLIELSTAGIRDAAATNHCGEVFVLAGETTVIWRSVVVGIHLRKDQGAGFEDLSPAGLFFCTALDRYPTKAPDEFPVPAVRIVVPSGRRSSN